MNHDGPAEQHRPQFPVRSSPEPVTAEPAAADETSVPGFVVGGLAVGADPARTIRRSTLVGASDDPAELEADQTAKAVVAVLRRAAAAGDREGAAPDTAASETAGRRSVVAALRRAAVHRSGPDGCDAPSHQAMGPAGGVVDRDTGARLAALRGNGTPLAPTIRRSMEAAFGTDLSDVRLHAGPPATELSGRLGAEAFTVGTDIAFRTGMPDLTTESGQHLLAHELTHVVQNRGGSLPPAHAEVEPATGRQPRMAAPARRTVRRVLRDANGQPSDLAYLIKHNPEQADEIEERERDRAVWTPVKSTGGQLIFRPYQPPSAHHSEDDDDWEAAADELLGPSSLPPTRVQSNPRLESEAVSSPKLETAKSQAPVLASPESSESGTLSWTDFKKDFKINRAQPYLTPLGQPRALPGPEVTGKPTSPVGYVANVLTTPRDGGVQAIIDRYAAQALPGTGASSFAMVIGVNRYRDLAGRSADAVQQAVAAVNEAPFPCTIVPFLWDFNWNRPFTDVQAAYQKLSPEDQERARGMEKENLIQSVIPYGSLREFVTSHQQTRAYVKLLSGTHKAVYVHLGDDDAASLEPSRGGPLLAGYTETIATAPTTDGRPPRLVVGGYAFRERTTDGSPTGDLDPAVAGELLTSIASKLDLWFRGVLAAVSPESVYPTEPNLAFLAAEGEQNHLEELLQPTKEEGKRLAKQESEIPEDARLTSGLLYGRNANEGGKLRKRIVEVAERGASTKSGGKGKGGKAKAKAEPLPQITFFDPSLAIATASTRFTLHDTDHRQHDPSEPPYSVMREESRQKSDGGMSWKAQIIEDLLTIKQSHIGVLTKELDSKYAVTIAADVMNCLRTVLLTGELPAKPSGKTPSTDFLLEMYRQRKGLREPIAQLHRYFTGALTPPLASPTTADSSPPIGLDGQVGASQLGGSQLGGSQLGGSQLGGSQLGGSQLGGSQLGGSQLGAAEQQVSGSEKPKEEALV